MKVKKIILVLTALTLTFGIHAQNKVKYFNGSLDEAIAEAQKRNKPLFVKTYTDWCYYCKKLDKEVLTDGGVAEQLNKDFIAYKINMEKGEGDAVAKKYKVNGYPTLLILDGEGNLINRLVGFRDAETLQPELKIALKNNDL